VSRELRQLVPVEIIAVLAIAFAPWPAMVPIALPLLVAATASRWARGRAWAEVTSKGTWTQAGIGMLGGLIALGVAIVVMSGGDGLSDLSGRSLEITVRGNSTLAVAVIVHVAVTAIAAELALRGWIVERVLELSPGSPVLPVLIGSIAEAIVTPGAIGTRLAAAVFGAGLGWLYVASGRNAVASICARASFQCGAVAIEALRLL
jgi:hypothetical protein